MFDNGTTDASAERPNISNSSRPDAGPEDLAVDKSKRVAIDESKRVPVDESKRVTFKISF